MGRRKIWHGHPDPDQAPRCLEGVHQRTGKPYRRVWEVSFKVRQTEKHTRDRESQDNISNAHCEVLGLISTIYHHGIPGLFDIWDHSIRHDRTMDKVSFAHAIP